LDIFIATSFLSIDYISAYSLCRLAFRPRGFESLPLDPLLGVSTATKSISEFNIVLSISMVKFRLLFFLQEVKY